MKTRSWIAVFAAAFIVFAGLALLLPRIGRGTVANVYRENERIWSVDLSKVEEPFEVTFDDGEGHVNIVEVEPGRIRVREANCPDGVCVKTGWISRGVTPIVCMPAKLVIRIDSGGDTEGFDAVTGGAG